MSTLGFNKTKITSNPKKQSKKENKEEQQETEDVVDMVNSVSREFTDKTDVLINQMQLIALSNKMMLKLA